MTREDVVQIRVDGHTVGIMGLKTALEESATTLEGKSDSQVTETLLNRLSKKNYIPAKVRDSYGKAFLREFKKFTGKPYEEEVISGLDIKVLGPGCSQCDGLERELMAAVSETGADGQYRAHSGFQGNRQMGGYGDPGPRHQRPGQIRGKDPPEGQAHSMD